jgi:glyoxylase-like metal-dependent hydrolase (beta-lactamase superfamily II)
MKAHRLSGVLSLLIFSGALLSVTAAAAAEVAPLQLKVITSGAASLHANFTLIMGEHDAVLVDAPFTRADALRLVADILDSGKQLKTIYITHDHPDHFFSLDVLTDNFPNAEVIAVPAVVDDIWHSIPIKMKRWGSVLGNNGPRHPAVPKAYDKNSFELEGRTIEILGPMQGDHVHSSALYIPSIKALICGDLVFNRIHLWLGESLPENRAAWLKSIEQLIALRPEIVVAGHKVPGLPDDASALIFTRDYLVAFEKAVKSSKNSQQLIATIQREFPDTQDVLGNFILGNSAPVAMNEAPVWHE